MRRVARPIAVAVVATVVAGLLVPNRSVAGAAVSGYLACLAACAAWGLLSSSPGARRGHGDLLRSALSPAPSRSPSSWPGDLLQLEGMVSAAASSALDTQFRLRPRLRALACSLLAARRGVVLDGETSDVAALLGIPGEPLLQRRPERRPQITEPGASMADIAAVLDRLEAI